MKMPVELKVKQAEYCDVFEDIVRVHKSHRPFSSAGEIITVSVNGRKANLAARGAKKNDKSAIWLDSKSREKLGIKPNETYEFCFKKASSFRQILWAWHTSQPAPRIAARLGVVSVVLGIIGLALGGISLW